MSYEYGKYDKWLIVLECAFWITNDGVILLLLLLLLVIFNLSNNYFYR